jgi:integrator complex subunit 4
VLASYRSVNNAILLQTFSKEIVSYLGRQKPHIDVRRMKRVQPKYLPTPEGDFDVDADEFRLLDSGACGAFVHGLEDEYQDVRYAAIGMRLRRVA